MSDDDTFRRLVESPAARKWPKDVRERIAPLGEHARHSEVQYLPAMKARRAASAAPPSAPAPAALEVDAPLQLEPWVTKGAIAGRLGVTPRTVDRWVQLGMPSAGPEGTVRFNTSECEGWARLHRETAGAPAGEQAGARQRVAQPRPSVRSEDVDRVGGARQMADRGEPRTNPAAELAPAATAPTHAIEPWVDVAAVAAHLACSEAHVRALAKRDDARRIPHRKDGHRLLFKLSRVDRWLDTIGAA